MSDVTKKYEWLPGFSPEECEVATTPPGVVAGMRHNAAVDHAKWLVRKAGGALEAKFYQFVLWNSRNEPPLSGGEIKAIWHDVVQSSVQILKVRQPKLFRILSAIDSDDSQGTLVIAPNMQAAIECWKEHAKDQSIYRAAISLGHIDLTHKDLLADEEDASSIPQGERAP